MSTVKTKPKKSQGSRKKSARLLSLHKIKPLYALLLIATVAVVGVFVVYRSFAATEPPPCSSGSSSLGYNIGFKNGKGYKIRLCRIDGFLSKGTEDGGYVRVASNASGNWVALFKAAKKSGINLVANSSFRSNAKQKELYDCWVARRRGCNPANPPGYSNHQSGEAIDIDIIPGDNNDPTLTQCLSNYKKYPVYYWLSQNAYKYKRYAHVASECWHWSPTGD